ncbi:ATP-binding protein [Cytobacillus spongiae]|jgi:two-component system sporulation sensor kinase B|uniref:ATP-binding protein n=1 Tax=Cytobacillus spongiae TaxID=2901381 RepID=UPI001F220DCC|nr:ATP-binding protein [Cytobacillus spongiae]UII56404.1 ATP-binding protein [Cytobacillus spongiae]
MIWLSPLLVNILILLLGIFSFQAYWTSPQKKWIHKNAMMTLLGLVCIFLIMSFPFKMSPESIYDLRKIPIIIGTLYGGWPVGLLLIMGMLGYRFLLGGMGAIYSIIIYGIIFISLFILKKRFDQFSKWQRVLWATIIATFGSIIGPVLNVFHGKQLIEEGLLLFYLGFLLINGISMALCIHIIENIIENIRLKESMVRNEKLTVIGQLAASLAHEIRNPLTASKGFLQLVQEQSTGELQEYTKISIDEMDRALAIINDYLSFSKPESKKFEPIDTIEIVEQATSVLTPYASLHNVTFEHDSTNAKIYGDKDHLLQCFVNIIKNAIEAMPKGGTINVYTQMTEDLVTLTFQDNGMGMTKSQVEKLGTPFFSTKEKGTGLGMMLVFSLIKSMNGTVDIQSSSGIGTTITISFTRI